MLNKLTPGRIRWLIITDKYGLKLDPILQVYCEVKGWVAVSVVEDKLDYSQEKD